MLWFATGISKLFGDQWSVCCFQLHMKGRDLHEDTSSLNAKLALLNSSYLLVRGGVSKVFSKGTRGLIKNMLRVCYCQGLLQKNTFHLGRIWNWDSSILTQMVTFMIDFYFWVAETFLTVNLERSAFRSLSEHCSDEKSSSIMLQTFQEICLHFHVFSLD